jgi:hypothetical protein
MNTRLAELALTRKTLFWYVKDVSSLSEEAILEGVLKYGNWKDFLNILEILGFYRFKEIFFKQISHKRVNYSPKTINLFQVYIKNHEHEYSQ